jgi:membrane-bound serine protease (ClpP class)
MLLHTTFLHTTNDPNTALLLILCGAVGICAEFCAPGLIVPGAIGSVLGLLGLASLAAFPISLLGVTLIVLSPVAFVLGARLAHRSMTVACTGVGTLAMALGSFWLLDARIHWSTVAATIPFALTSSFLIAAAVRARSNKTSWDGEPSAAGKIS